ncbi:hypothetical protein JCM6882_005361 [Rhodosporidiobolus microsporus]
MLMSVLLAGASVALAAPQLPQAVFSLPPTSSFSPSSTDLAPSLSLAPSLKTLSHPHHPHHRIRLTHPTGLCDPDVNQTSGYLDTARGHHTFFWQFDSRGDVAKDPVVLWLNGGPGCSSFTGLLQELGPCKAREKGNPVYNPYSWTNNATVIFMDQPIGVGFSYADKGSPKVWTSEAAAEDLYAFLHIFFETFADKFAHSEFHIAGESYAGRYIPVFADYIVKQNALAEANGMSKINLRSVLIGNGFTHPLLQWRSYLPAGCGSALGGPFLSAQACRKMQAAWPVCERLVEGCWANPKNTALCMSAYRFCETRMMGPYDATGRSPYNVDKFGGYEEDKWIERWLNREDVRRQLGVDRPKKFSGCSDKVFERFEDSEDVVRPAFHQLATVLDSGVSVLLYVGAKDYICNIVGVEAFSIDPSFAELWSNGTRFAEEEKRGWYASPRGEGEEEGERRKAGEYRQYGRLAFAGVEGAGHFVPYDKPREALALFNGWVHEGRVGYA